MSGTPTTKYALPTIAGTDLISGIDDWSVAAMGAIDGLLTPSTQGTLAFRPTSTIPSPGIIGRTYYATDTNQLFRDTGTGWTEIVLATGLAAALAAALAPPAWQTLALAGGWVSSPSVRYLKDALGFVSFRAEGFTTPGGGVAAFTTLFTMPSGYRPGVSGAGFAIIDSGAFGPVPVTISATTGNVINNVAFAGSHAYYFSHIRYLAEN